MQKEDKKRLLDMLANDNLVGVLNKVKMSFSHDYPDWFIQTSARLNKLQSEIEMGKISDKDAFERKNKIRSSLISRIKKEEFRDDQELDELQFESNSSDKTETPTTISIETKIKADKVVNNNGTINNQNITL